MVIKLSKKRLENIRFAIMNELMKQEPNQKEYYKSLSSSLKIITKVIRKND